MPLSTHRTHCKSNTVYKRHKNYWLTISFVCDDVCTTIILSMCTLLLWTVNFNSNVCTVFGIIPWVPMIPLYFILFYQLFLEVRSYWIKFVQNGDTCFVCCNKQWNCRSVTTITCGWCSTHIHTNTHTQNTSRPDTKWNNSDTRRLQ
jgi:hypothetical protein